MTPISPVLTEEFVSYEVVYGKNQPEFLPLPTLRNKGTVLSRWKLTDEERAAVAAGADVMIEVIVGRDKLQPLRARIAATDGDVVQIAGEMGLIG